MLGDRIKELRKKRGLSLRDLAGKIDISISFLSDIENNRSRPSLDRLRDVAEGLETTVSYLLGESLAELPGDEDFQRVLSELQDFKNWPDRDKEELLNYLRAKRLIREG